VVGQKKDINDSAAIIVFLMCLYIAAKFTGESSPEFTAYKQVTLDSNLGSESTIALEKFIMNCLTWKCSFVTVSDILNTLFTEYFKEEINDELGRKAVMIVDFSLAGIYPS